MRMVESTTKNLETAMDNFCLFMVDKNSGNIIMELDRKDFTNREKVKEVAKEFKLDLNTTIFFLSGMQYMIELYMEDMGSIAQQINSNKEIIYGLSETITKLRLYISGKMKKIKRRLRRIEKNEPPKE